MEGARLFSWAFLALFLALLLGKCFGQFLRSFEYVQSKVCPGRMMNPETFCSVVFSEAVGRIQCAGSCGQDRDCVAFLWNPTSGSCLLCTTTCARDCQGSIPAGGVEVYHLKCHPGASRINGQCQCPLAYGGATCKIRMTDCDDWKAEGETVKGARWIYPALAAEPFPLFCEFTWRRQFILRRTKKGADYYQNWTQYANGFGDPANDFWLGLNKIHILTHSRCYRMMVELTLANKTQYQQHYNDFRVADETNLFAFTFTSTFPKQNPAGDCLGDVMGKPFSTYDADHDDDVDGNCAVRHHSGWWFGNCTQCNPTGILRRPLDMLREGETEVYWTPGMGDLVPKYIKMTLSRC